MAPRFRIAAPSDGPTSPPILRPAKLKPQSNSESGAGEASQPIGLLADIGAVWLVHGTFVGNDAVGFFRDLGRLFPDLADPMLRWHKQFLDTIVGDRGNYSQRYADYFAEYLDLDKSVPVRLFHWSSENHHIGRADGAIRLIQELIKHTHDDDRRILILSHSHGGNLIALLTNLLGGETKSIEHFFDLCRPYWRLPWVGRIDFDRWPIVRDTLLSGRAGHLARRLDLVTFGTPVLYGWERRGCARLMHVIHHRPGEDGPPDRAQFPFSLDDFRRARLGDYIQQLGIAGTSVSPGWLQWRARRADKRLGRWLHPGTSRRNLLRRLKHGVRAHHEGQNVLVDYEHVEKANVKAMGGHAVYSLLDWIPFHVELINEFFYGDQPLIDDTNCPMTHDE